MNRNVVLMCTLISALTGTVSTTAAQDYNALSECTSLSPDLDDIHTCMDNYLDILDGSISGVTDFLAQSLSGEALAGLDRSQQAFVEYRRQNCLWYLEFSSPRAEAEQIAKNCLASMSQRRLSELQRLVGIENKTDQVLRGFYVYGPDRNSFQLCGDDKRYWLEGDNLIVSRTQQLYLTIATEDLQVLHAVFAGTVDVDEQAPANHQGVLKVDTLIELRVPTESDCRLPGGAVRDTLSLPDPELSGIAEVESDRVVDVSSQEEPEQQLLAYFGAWTVDCTESRDIRACKLIVAFENTDSEVAADQELATTLVLLRQKQLFTALEVVFPGREIDSPTRIRWQVDAQEFGDVVGSRIRVDETATRQLIPASRFVRRDLLPMMIAGAQLRLEVLESIDDPSGEQFTATLKGLTRALEFADEFVRESDF